LELFNPFARRTAGTWLFAGRRWLNPDDPDDRSALLVNYDNLCLLFPAFAAACPVERFLETLTDVSASWRRRLGEGGPAPMCMSIADHGPGERMSPVALTAADFGPAPAQMCPKQPPGDPGTPDPLFPVGTCAPMPAAQAAGPDACGPDAQAGVSEAFQWWDL
jgi:hypothetical protein